MRLTEKGYRVLVLERGKRFRDQDFAKSTWHVRKYLWFPALRCFGILQISPFRDVFVLHGSGVGGGSLGYANVLMEPSDKMFAAPGLVASGRLENDPQAALCHGQAHARRQSQSVFVAGRFRHAGHRRRTGHAGHVQAHQRRHVFWRSRARPCPIRTSAVKDPIGPAASIAAAAWSAVVTARRTRSSRTICTSPRNGARKSGRKPKCAMCARCRPINPMAPATK